MRFDLSLFFPTIRLYAEIYPGFVVIFLPSMVSSPAHFDSMLAPFVLRAPLWHIIDSICHRDSMVLDLKGIINEKVYFFC